MRMRAILATIVQPRTCAQARAAGLEQPRKQMVGQRQEHPADSLQRMRTTGLTLRPRTPHQTSWKPPFGFMRAVLRELAPRTARGATAGLFVLPRLGEAPFGTPRMRSRYG